MVNKNLFLFYISIILWQISAAQQPERHFRSISVDKGLSQSTVFAIKQDTLGFIWTGTQDGLNRYDGQRFSVYRPVDGNPRSLQSYYIPSLFVDSRGRLWIGGNKGLSVYHYDTDDFTNYAITRSPGEWYISNITEDKQQQIWAISLYGDVVKFPKDAKQPKVLDIDLHAYGIKQTNYIGLWQGDIVIGSDIGFFRLAKNENSLVKINVGFPKVSINDAFVEGDIIRLATEGFGLITLNGKTGQIQNHTREIGKNSLVDNNVRVISKDALGNYWLGTFRGLSIYNVQANTFHNYEHHPSQPSTINQNSVRTIFRDRQNGMWLGTFYGGINYYHKNNIAFNLLSQNTVGLRLNDNVISTIKEDANGNIWIGTNDKGLNIWNRKNKTIKYISYSENNTNGLSSDNIKAIVFDNYGNVLIGTHKGGLNVLNSATGSFKHYKHNDNDPQSIAGDLVYALLNDSKGRIWVGTRSGLDLFNPKTGVFNHIHIDKTGKRLNSEEITFLFEDSRHRIWIGTTSGVMQFYPDNLLFGKVNKGNLTDDYINCITEDAQKRIWLGTRRGLSIFNEKTKTFNEFQTTSDQEIGNINGVLSDNENNLWISTNNGLISFNPDTKALRYFNESDGLQNNQFNVYSFCKTHDGMMLFGGIKGLSYFYPEEVRQPRIHLQVKFTGLDIFHKSVVANDASEMLSGPLDNAQKLTFDPESKQFSIYFNSFNYMSINHTYYLYKLDGLDKEWQKTTDPKVTYTNLPAGSYKFMVKAIGPNGEQSAVRTMKVSILPVWYKSTWFYFLMLALAVAGIYIAYRIISERLRTLHQLKLERSEKEKVRYINQVKMDFFTNVSHELRTPLTLILAPLEDLLAKPSADSALNRQLKLMFANAKRLYHLVDQLFEFKKTEMGTRKLKVQQADLVSFVDEVYESFRPLSERNHIQYTYKSADGQLAFPFDKDAMERILFNLLSNAFKYTKPNGSVHVDLSSANGFAVIKIADTGIGIEANFLEKIFDRFYQVDNQEMNLGSGVGLAFTKRLVEQHHGNIVADSKPGKGTEFTVKIPIAASVYANDSRYTTASDIFSPVEILLQADDSNEMADSDTPKINLLVVDDHHEIVSYLQDYFSRDYHVLTAYDGKQALEISEAQTVDIIVSDVMMPEMDGLHFCKKMKQNIITSHIPIILLTAQGDLEHQIKGYEMGADDYVAKPFSARLLDAKIKNLLRSRRRLKEFYSANKDVVPENVAFNPLDEEFLRNAVNIIEAHLSDSDFSVDKFSREIGMSRSNLYLKLKAITGESANDFVKRIRFNKAVELMQSKRYTMAQITYMCGFNSPSYFSTAFKQYFGCIPTEYLATLAKNKQENEEEAP